VVIEGGGRFACFSGKGEDGGGTDRSIKGWSEKKGGKNDKQAKRAPLYHGVLVQGRRGGRRGGKSIMKASTHRGICRQMVERFRTSKKTKKTKKKPGAFFKQLYPINVRKRIYEKSLLEGKSHLGLFLDGCYLPRNDAVNEPKRGKLSREYE